ncbi:VOC family protein [Serinicoccus sp. CUA-874]|uniref:VOC family protein n=1 Tax=Serinicoccus sp. CUA-874 TaxID=1517939 RepID=UPI00192CF7CC|nr:VOC family protein [Serinicoccus sp. CUA-874]
MRWAERAQEAPLDHLVLAVPDLDQAVEELREQTGVSAAAGGSHPGMGTRNALVALRGTGGPAYLELLAPDPAQEPVAPEATMLGLGHLVEDGTFSPRLHAWAIRPGDLDRTLALARDAGLEVGTATPASRRTRGGTELSWRLAVPHPLGLGGVQPFLIDWGSSHPTDDDLPELDLVELTLGHPDPDRAQQVLDVLGAGGAVVGAPRPTLGAVVAGPGGQTVL